jgi:A/G-specific adenine glycosylase
MAWQGQRDPYPVWLSEVMLQQTQVTTAAGYYDRFIGRFPDVAALAAAPLDDVLAHWSGLGYYSRARNLHRCAQTIVREHGGAFPRASVELALLPGIGRSTAAAIAAFCFSERAAILDGNVKRVLARHTGFDGDLSTTPAQRALWARAEALLPEADDMAAYTQGLMDLGATVCLPRQPRCASCPVAQDCVARLGGRTAQLPLKSRRTRRGSRHNVLLWLRCGGRVLLTRRPERGVWAGLWSLPEFDSVPTVLEAVEHWPGAGEALTSIVHALSHFDWTLDPLRWDLPASTNARALRSVVAQIGGDTRWWPAADALALSLPAPVRKLLTSAT